jgi:hypothetical protein
MASNAAAYRACSPCADASRACDAAAARKYACSSPARSAVGETGGMHVPTCLPPALTAAELTALAMDPNALKMEGLATGAAAGGHARTSGLRPRARARRVCAMRRRAHQAPEPDARVSRAPGALPALAHGNGSSLVSQLQAVMSVPDASSPTPAGGNGNGNQSNGYQSNGNGNKRRGPRSATSKFRGVSCYKRCAPSPPGCDALVCVAWAHACAHARAMHSRKCALACPSSARGGGRATFGLQASRCISARFARQKKRHGA